MRLVQGIGQVEAEKIRDAVARHGPFAAILPLWRRSGVRAATIRRLAAADAFGSMGLSRQRALWHARLLRDDKLPLFDAAPESAEDEAPLPAVDPLRQVVLDYDATGLSLKSHPVAFARPRLRDLGAVPCADLRDPARTPDTGSVTVAGLVLNRQRPATASGVTFMTLEDESGIANLVVWRDVYQRFRRAAGSRLLVVHGRVQREGDVVHVVVAKLQGLDEELDGLAAGSRDFR
jgi:error-prone DNA polymerase